MYVAVYLLKHGVWSDPTDRIRMPATEGSAEEGQPSGRREDRITQLKPPAPLYFEALDLADMLEEMEARSRIVHGFSDV